MQWYQLSITDIFAHLGVDDKHGLDEKEVLKRRQKYGRNEIVFKKIPVWVRFFKQFQDPMIIILLITAAITGTLTLFGKHMLPDTIVIISVVLLNAVLGFVQEDKAEGALDALRSMMVPECMVMRKGNIIKMPSGDLVPGDIVVLEGGDKIPADIRFIDLSNAHVDESSLTGESVPVEKSVTVIDSDDNVVPADQHNMGFSGTYLTRGTARGIVVETGSRTVFGRIADMVKTADKGITPLQHKMTEFIHILIKAILLVGAFNFLYGIYLGYEMSYSFLGAVSLVVAAIPEMLPALVTAILAVSGTIMASRKALIRHLPAAETLGAVSVICSDKTGTLTENRMTVTKVYAGEEVFDVSGVGYDTKGEFTNDNKIVTPKSSFALYRMLEIGFHCNNSHIKNEGGIIGDPTEGALKVSALKAGIAEENVNRISEIPFDSATKFMAVLIRFIDDGKTYIFVKGAPELILNMCTLMLNSDGSNSLLDKEKILASARSFANEALRTLAFAFKLIETNQDDLTHHDITGLTFAGLQGMIDPARPAAIKAVGECKSAGIRTIMVTGDHPDTARAVARKLGIEAERSVTGAELAKMDTQTLQKFVEEVSVFARVAPEHKRDIAEALQKNGHVVAMTGDGVNDAPALKQADIGVSMGIVGTEVARESSDMVLADDNFATIVNAVEEGRHAWTNLQKAILYTLPTNAAQAMLIMGAILLAAFIPLFSVRFVLEPVQILWINLLDSVLLTLPLMMEKKEKWLLKRPPRKADAHIIDPLFIQRVVIMGLAISLPGFYIYYHFGSSAIVNGKIVDILLTTQAQTAAFWAILFAHFGYVVSARSIYDSAFSFNPFGNKWLIGGIGLSIAIRFIPTFIPEAAELFRTAEFPIEWWPIILLCFFPSFIAIETDKFIRKRMA